jgi:hypothetical protein
MSKGEQPRALRQSKVICDALAPPVGRTFLLEISVRKSCRRSGRLASPPAIEWRIYCGPAPRLPAWRSEGD